MKIIVLTDVYLPYFGGGQLYLSNIVSRLCKRKDVKIEIVTRKLKIDKEIIDKSEKLENGKLTITRLGYSASWNSIFSRIVYIFLAVNYLLNKDFDLIDAQAFIGAIPGKIISFIKKKPVILMVHGTTLETGHAGLIEKIILTKIKYDAQISAASNFLKLKNINHNISVVNPGVDTNFYKPDFSKKKQTESYSSVACKKSKEQRCCFNALTH